MMCTSDSMPEKEPMDLYLKLVCAFNWLFGRVRMQEIRAKSRIKIDPSIGRVLLGVVDETFSLEYGQVFIQMSSDVKNPLSTKIILQQTVLVGKSPCLHPGRISIFPALVQQGVK